MFGMDESLQKQQHDVTEEVQVLLDTTLKQAVEQQGTYNSYIHDIETIKRVAPTKHSLVDFQCILKHFHFFTAVFLIPARIYADWLVNPYYISTTWNLQTIK